MDTLVHWSYKIGYENSVLLLLHFLTLPSPFGCMLTNILNRCKTTTSAFLAKIERRRRPTCPDIIWLIIPQIEQKLHRRWHTMLPLIPSSPLLQIEKKMLLHLYLSMIKHLSILHPIRVKTSLFWYSLANFFLRPLLWQSKPMLA